MSVTITPLATIIAAAGQWSPGGTTYNSSGDSSGTTTQDTYVHTQSVDAKYNRVNQYNYSASTPFTTPSIVQSFLEISYTVQSNDEIIYNANFGGDLVSLQVLELVADASSGFGTQGAVNTSAMGVIRRAARKDANGIILDPTGVCVQTGTINLDVSPGTFNGDYDTSANVNGILGQLINNLPNTCSTFSPTLVDL